MNKCDYCINKKDCNICNKYKDRFIPNDEVKKYFRYIHTGRDGFNGFSYRFDTTNEDLIQTHSIQIGYHQYCPYCGEQMYFIQDPYTLYTIGLCCICDGARAEMEYEEKKYLLEKKFNEELSELKNEYKNKLKFRTDKLIEIKHKIEKQNIHCDYNHFYTINGKNIFSLDQII